MLHPADTHPNTLSLWCHFDIEIKCPIVSASIVIKIIQFYQFRRSNFLASVFTFSLSEVLPTCKIFLKKM